MATLTTPPQLNHRNQQQVALRVQRDRVQGPPVLRVGGGLPRRARVSSAWLAAWRCGPMLVIADGRTVVCVCICICIIYMCVYVYMRCVRVRAWPRPTTRPTTHPTPPPANQPTNQHSTHTIDHDRAEEPAMTMALAFALLLELGDPASKWRAYWDSFPQAKHVPNIFDFDGDLVRSFESLCGVGLMSVCSFSLSFFFLKINRCM